LNSNSEPYEYDQFKQMIKNLYSEFPVITHQVHDIFAKGDKVTVIFSAHASHGVDSFGFPAAGRKLEWKEIAVFQISNGKIKTDGKWRIC
jgi:predicted ester cyclase